MKIRKIIYKGSVILSVTFLTACSFFSPEYERPKTDTPNVWLHEGDTTTTDKQKWDLPKLAWWRLFNDPQLNSFITIALKDNQQLQVAIGNIKQSEAEIEKANYAWLPTASVGGGGFIGQAFGTNINSSIPQAKQFLSQGTETFGGSLVGVVPSYTINLVREIKIGEVARYSKKMQTELKNTTRLSIITQVAASYFSLVTAKAQLDLQIRKVEEYELLQYFAQKQYDAGAASSLSIKMINQQLESERGKIASIKNDIVHFENSLSVLMGQNPSKVISGKTLNEINTSHEVPVNLPAKVLENRPDVAIAEYRLQTANANIGLARSQFFPSIDLTGAFGNATLALAQLATMNAGVWAAEAVAAVPVFNMAILADSDKAKAQFYQGYYEYINTIHKALQDVNDSLSEHSSAKETMKRDMLALEATNEQTIIFNKKYEKGAISKMEFTGASINNTNAQMQVNQTKLKELISIVNLYQSLGSGYDVDNHMNVIESNPAWNK
ncbi:efflux transporter outer membrane subunit [Pseudofrancisella aestuarii]|uniref:Efflux transporter outer membrane subunit n=1 Tax=Pseudofrancisella aestuarii TaxID=2670347 RepID=A0ABV9T951_9GAMM|nr:efflux transporter outer membrane subunit [Pseudofrancisella aestuarii]